MKFKKLPYIFVLATALLISGCKTGQNSSSEEISSSGQPSESSSGGQQSQSASESQSASQSQSGGKSSSQGGGQSSSSSSAGRTSSSSQGGGQSSSAQPATQGNFSFNNDIIVAQEIHTDNQKKFCEYGKEYYNITSSELNSFGAGGNSENSFPKQVKITWNYTAPSGKTVSKYQVVLGQKSDLSDGYTMNGTTATNISFYNAFIGDNYFKVIANLNDGSREESEIKVLKVASAAPRNLKIGNMSNCRDMGGRTTYAGGKIKQGLIYRTSDPSGNVNDDVKEVMLNFFKVKSEIYVKDGGGNGPSPLGSSVQYYNCSMDYGATPYSNFARNAERLRKVFSVLKDENNYPTFYHCRIGTDRTGICGVAINGLLGVPFNEVIQDYAFSNFGKIDGQRYAHKSSDPNGDDIAKYIEEILKMPGKNFQEQTYNSLLSIGIPAADLNKVIDIMTEGTKATLPSDSIIATANSLTNNGGSKKTASDYTHPDTYIAIKSGQSVSYKVNMAAAGKADIVCYLGCTNSSSSTKLASGIELQIDGQAQTIVDKTYLLAGFGTTQQARRTGYMFNLLGNYNLTAGEHTITIAGKNSDTFNIGTIALFGTGNGGQQGGQDNPPAGGDHDHTWGTATPVSETGKVSYNKYTCSCGAVKIEIAATAGTFASGSSNKSGTPEGYLKLNENGNSISYTFNYNAAKSGKIYFDGIMDSWSGNQNNGFFTVKNSSNTNGNFELKVNGSAVDFSSKRDVKYSEMFVGTAEISGYSARSTVEVGACALVNGENTINFKRVDSYNVLVKNFVIVLDK